MSYGSMEFKVIEKVPGKLVINYEELKAALSVELEKYKGLVVTENQITEAKSTRAKLNKVKAAIEDRRKELKKEYLKPYEIVEKQAKELVDMIDEASSNIANQIKEFEEKEKEAKKIQIANLWVKLGYNKITVDKIWNEKWLNKTFALSKIKEEMQAQIDDIEGDLNAIKELCGEDKQKCLTLQSKYLRTLDFQQVLSEYNAETEAAKKIIAEEKAVKAEQEPITVVSEEPQEEVEVQTEVQITRNDLLRTKLETIYEIKFAVIGTEKQIKALSKFMFDNNIKFEILKGE
jgi:uncharacterized protein YukE